MSNTPAHATIIRSAIERAIAAIAGGRPARVETYDAVKQRADVQPLVLDGRIDVATGERVTEQQPMMTDVPVIMLGTTRSRTTMDIRPGDTVWLCPAVFSLDAYLIHGGVVDPQDDRRHHISDAVCFPAVFDFVNVPGDASTDGTVIHTPRLRLGGSDAADPIVRKSDLDAVVQSIKADLALLKNHVHAGVTTGVGVSGTSATIAGIGGVTTPACSPVVSSK